MRMKLGLRALLLHQRDLQSHASCSPQAVTKSLLFPADLYGKSVPQSQCDRAFTSNEFFCMSLPLQERRARLRSAVAEGPRLAE